MNDVRRDLVDGEHTISTVAWAVPPRYDGAVNRPVRLVTELIRLGVIDAHPQYIYHGRSKPNSEAKRAFPLLPAVAMHGVRSAAILSPLFLLSSGKSAVWWDIYDDWSLGSNFKVAFRLMARAGYWRVRHDQRVRKSSTVTTNNDYMADRIGGRGVHVVPNGVDPHLGVLSTGEGDGVPTLLVLGRFIESRTDLKLLEACMMSEEFGRIIIGAPEPTIDAVIRRVSTKRPGVVELRDWISEDELAALACPRTKALVPNLVNPYTRSQDLMKAYTFAALGIPTICPEELWPETLTVSTALLLRPHADIDVELRRWAHVCRASVEERHAVVKEHSWGVRAEAIASLLRGT